MLFSGVGLCVEKGFLWFCLICVLHSHPVVNQSFENEDGTKFVCVWKVRMKNEKDQYCSKRTRETREGFYAQWTMKKDVENLFSRRKEISESFYWRTEKSSFLVCCVDFLIPKFVHCPCFATLKEKNTPTLVNGICFVYNFVSSSLLSRKAELFLGETESFLFNFRFASQI